LRKKAHTNFVRKVVDWLGDTGVDEGITLKLKKYGVYCVS
jgi:hypothetical protein